MRRSPFAAVVCCSLFTGTALAEPPAGTEYAQYYDEGQGQYDQGQYDQGQYDQGQYDQNGQYYDPNQQQVQQQQVVVQEQNAYDGRGLQYGANLFVPIWLGNIGKDVRPGIGIHGRAGWELGHGLSIEGGIGAMVNPDNGWFDGGTLVNVFFTGGVRYAFLNPTALVPFIHGALQVNLWDACDAGGFCSSYSELTVGFNAGAGLIFEINYNAALEVGLNVAGTTAGDILYNEFTGERFHLYMSPFVGFTLYY